jgi:hypothetical protein
MNFMILVTEWTRSTIASNQAKKQLEERLESIQSEIKKLEKRVSQCVTYKDVPKVNQEE